MLSLEVIINAIEKGSLVGYCTHCQAEITEVKSDTRYGFCPYCGIYAIFSVKELLLAAALASQIEKESQCSC